MTPLYDIMSAHPLITKKQLQAKKIKMAMALTGDNHHYLWHTIQPPHFISTALQAGFNEKTARAIVSETLDAVDGVVSQVEALLPAAFPANIAEPILKGMRRQRDRHAKPDNLVTG